MDVDNLKICTVEQELERCHLCDGIVARGDAVRESLGIDEDGVEYGALEHALCIAEDDRLGISWNLNADERGACMADLAEIEDCEGEPVSPEYRAFRTEVDARVPAMTVDVRRLVLMERDLAATLARAKAAEAKAAELVDCWRCLRDKVTMEAKKADATDPGCDRWDTLDDVRIWMDDAESGN